MNKKRISPVHPGVYLKELLDELKLSQYRLARELGVPAMRINHVVNGKRPVTAELALTGTGKEKGDVGSKTTYGLVLGKALVIQYWPRGKRLDFPGSSTGQAYQVRNDNMRKVNIEDYTWSSPRRIVKAFPAR